MVWARQPARHATGRGKEGPSSVKPPVKSACFKLTLQIYPLCFSSMNDCRKMFQIMIHCWLLLSMLPLLQSCNLFNDYCDRMEDQCAPVSPCYFHQYCWHFCILVALHYGEVSYWVFLEMLGMKQEDHQTIQCNFYFLIFKGRACNHKDKSK